MEKIKYKAWLIDEKRMVAVDAIHFNFPHDGTICDITYIDDTKTELHFGEDVILRPFTGLLDKNKKEIYKKDIIRKVDVSVDRGTYEDSGVVEYVDGGFYVSFRDNSCMYLNALLDYNSIVIGNIYENPELLKIRSPFPRRRK